MVLMWKSLPLKQEKKVTIFVWIDAIKEKKIPYKKNKKKKILSKISMRGASHYPDAPQR